MVRVGSYRYDTINGRAQESEFERLNKQASAILEVERELWPTLGIVSGNSVLDIGCGSGSVTSELAKQVYPSQVVGIDKSQALLRKAQSFYAENDRNDERVQLDFQSGSVYDLPFDNDTFDVVYARLVFQHLNEPLIALDSALRVLKPGGIMCILDIDKDWSSLHPDPSLPVQLDQAIAERQIREGGDPYVGRKLGSYLKSSGFSSVKTNISLVDSDRLGLDRFVEMLSFGRSYQSKDNEFTSMQAKIRPAVQSLLDNPYAWAGFGLFVVTGHKL